MKDSTKLTGRDPLIQNLLQLLRAHRPVFRQARTYRRCMSMVLGELFSFARHTVTQNLLAMGMIDGDWSAWYEISLDGFGPDEGYHPDVNFDGMVNIQDLAVVAGNYDLDSETAYADWISQLQDQ